MTREEAKEQAKDYLEDYLRSIGINTSKAFCCINPDHNDRRPSMSINPKDRRYCKCFSCNAYYDIYDAVAINERLEQGSNEAFIKTWDIIGLDVEGTAQSDFKYDLDGNEVKRQPKIKKTATKQDHKQDLQDKAYKDTLKITKLIYGANTGLFEHKEALQHFKDRGLSEDTIKKFLLGYVDGGMNDLLKEYPDNQRGGKGAKHYKYIIPMLRNNKPFNFIAEIDDRKNTNDYNSKYAKVKKTPTTLYLEDNLKEDNTCIFICEGYYDALSVEEIGHKAVALGGTSHNIILDHITPDVIKRNNYYIVSTDNDKGGREASLRLAKELKQRGVPYVVMFCGCNEKGQDLTSEYKALYDEDNINLYEYDNPKGYKDFNEFITSDRQGFIELVEAVEKDTKLTSEEQLKEDYLQNSASNRLVELDNTIQEYDKEPIRTGFRELDDYLQDGIRTGLYVVGAVTGLGKTTFILQIADYIAKQGHDVLYFSLEMTKAELMAKSISRNTFEIIRGGFYDKDGQPENKAKPKTTTDILLGYRYDNYSLEEHALIMDAKDRYRKEAKHLYIIDGLADISTDDIRQRIETHKTITGNSPVVFVDYAQILKAKDVRLSDKQKTDLNIVDLKCISRDYKTPVIAISSTNRASYQEPIDRSSFKESGAIEFTSDVLIGLQYEGMNYKKDKKVIEDKKTGEAKEIQIQESDAEHKRRVNDLLKEQTEKKKNGQPQNIELKILKNRHGYETGNNGVHLNLYPQYNYYVDDKDEFVLEVFNEDDKQLYMDF